MFQLDVDGQYWIQIRNVHIFDVEHQLFRFIYVDLTLGFLKDISVGEMFGRSSLFFSSYYYSSWCFH